MLLLLLACNGKDDSAAADDSGVPSGRRFAGTIVDHLSGDPIPDADICLLPENVCQQTSSDGAFTIYSQRPKDEEFKLFVAEPPWVTLAVPLTVPSGDAPEDTFEMWTTDEIADGASSATLLVTVIDGVSDLPSSGVTVSLEGASEATTDTAGEALFVGLDENNSATITVSGVTCTGLYAWAGLTDGTFRAKLENGTFFSTRLRCQ